ncbi:MAG TPA: alpha/beta fold hydrolase [Gemmatimonadales bacterium]|nr:alpha/beta fold hydrolase [Gemmatimonadales bacterium]
MRRLAFSHVLSLVSAWSLIIPQAAPAQATFPPVALPRTEVRRLQSRGVGVEYKLYVSLPRGYEENQRDYPVVLLLDADYSFALARNIVEHLSDRGDLPQAVLVGIAYGGPEAYRKNRTRDYTPTFVPTGGYGPEYQAVSGGGPRFRDFIAHELVPFLDHAYRVSTRRYLVGHSYGGLFATWVALTDPELFSGYVIVSPSLWYDDGLIFSLEEEVARRHPDWPARAYLIVGDREINQQHNMVADLRRLATTLERRHYPGLQLRWEVAADETHNSIFPRGLSNGLRFVLGGR